MDIENENKKMIDFFEYKVPGKWILAGEHAVIRGSEAIVFPLTQKYLKFTFKNKSHDFYITVGGTYKNELELFIWSLFEKYLNILNIKRDNIKGHLDIQCEIQFGAGMGASATLAVGLSLFFNKLGFLNSDLFEFSKKIEDLFHGESSGVDIAVALNNTALLFKRGEKNKYLKNYKLPQLCISYSGIRGVTKDCVEKVKELLVQNPETYLAVDLKMKQSVDKFKIFLASNYLIEDQQWSETINLAQSCFADWDLIPTVADKHIQLLKNFGALSCKMTGSGGGGYILSLWPNNMILKNLPDSIFKQLIQIEKYE